MNTATIGNTEGKNTAGRAAWVCLIIAWVAFIVPIPFAGVFVGWPLISWLLFLRSSLWFSAGRAPVCGSFSHP